MLVLLAAALLTTAIAQLTGTIGEIPRSLDRLRPAEWFDSDLSFTSTKSGSSGCSDIFGNTGSLKYTGQGLDDAATDVAIPVAAFAMNGTSCSGDRDDGYSVSARVPGRGSVFGALGALVIDSASPILEHLFYLERDAGGMTRVTCPGGLRLGDGISIMYNKKKIIATPDPREGRFTFKKFHRYLAIEIGSADNGPDEICILEAGEWEKADVLEIGKRVKRVGGGVFVIAVSIVGSIVVCAAVGGLLAYAHFGR